MIMWGGYGYKDLEDGPPGCEKGDLRCSPTPVQNCMSTPTVSPMPYPDFMSRSWICEHRWTGVAGLTNFRKACRGHSITQTWSHEQEGIRKGHAAFRLGNT